MENDSSDIITADNYVVIQRGDYKRLYRVTTKSDHYKFGKDFINMTGIIGKPYWTTFNLVPSKERKNVMDLEVMKESITPREELKDTLTSGVDNRTIIDDGTSQKLSKEDIISLRESGISGKEIINTLIENNTSFAEKTEYSQEKYIKKKERKYYKPITVHKTSIRSLVEIYSTMQDIKQINSLRMDTVAQMLSYCNVRAQGLYLLFDSQSKGLPAASLLDRIGANTTGQLINLHTSANPNISTVQAMNFPAEQMDRMTSVNIFSFLRYYYHSHHGASRAYKRVPEREIKDYSMEIEPEELEELGIEVPLNYRETLKRKNQDHCDQIPDKRLKWTLHCETAVELVKNNPVDGLVIVAKEDPTNIATTLIKFLGASRPFVIFHLYREPLMETYAKLKQKYNVVNMKLFSNFLRTYQVLPDRTHPDITTNDCSGYLLTGYLADS